MSFTAELPSVSISQPSTSGEALLLPCIDRNARKGSHAGFVAKTIGKCHSS